MTPDIPEPSLPNPLPAADPDQKIWGAKAREFLAKMWETGPLFRQCASWIVDQKIKIYITREAKGVGAGWHQNLFGTRWISIDKSFGFTDSLIALGHEARHLQQSVRVRCSVEGEYAAWRLGYRLRAESSSSGGETPMTADERALAAMPDDPAREDLKTAQGLMQRMAGPDYLIGRAPLQGRDWQTVFIAPAVVLFNSFLGRGEQQ